MQLDFLIKLGARLLGAKLPRKPGNALLDPPAEATEWQRKAACLLIDLGYDTLAARIAVQWNSRMRSTAGAAFVRHTRIILNPRLNDFGPGEIDRTLRHELAHLLAQHRAGRCRIAPHGREWRQACVDLGLLDENRCHSLPLPSRELRRRYCYQCTRCGLEIRRVKPLRRATACLVCCRLYSHGRFDERFRFKKVHCCSDR